MNTPPAGLEPPAPPPAHHTPIGTEPAGRGPQTQPTPPGSWPTAPGSATGLPAGASPMGPGPDGQGSADMALILRGFVRKYGRMLWWLHSLYALGLGIAVVMFAQRGFRHARWLSISLAAVWIVLILFFRFFSSGSEPTLADRNAKIRFYVMTYVLKNLYQGMLFFLLPFYWRTAVSGAATQWFVVAIAVCAFLSTLDVIFDQLLMRFKLAASLFYFFTLFCCLNLVIPALMPNTRSLATLVGAGAISAIAFWTMHVPLRFLGRPIGAALLLMWTTLALAGSYFGRSAVPPAAMYVAAGAVGPRLLEDGRLAIEASSLHTSVIEHDLFAVTRVVTPGGRGDRLLHVWRKDGVEIQRSSDADIEARASQGAVRIRSKLGGASLPADPVGAWQVDVQTQDGQLVGRVRFEVIR